MFNIRSSIGPIKSRLSFSKAFSITISRALSRAVVYQGHGAPSQVLRIQSYPHLPPPPPQSLNLQFILSPINPADINVIEGIYPSKPRLRTLFTSARLGEGAQEAYIAGNEGLARITSIGAGVPGNYKVGDWVVMLTPQLGTWCSTLNVKLNDVLLVPNSDKLSEVQAATMMVRLELSIATPINLGYYASLCAAESHTMVQTGQSTHRVQYASWFREAFRGGLGHSKRGK